MSGRPQEAVRVGLNVGCGPKDNSSGYDSVVLETDRGCNGQYPGRQNARYRSPGRGLQDRPDRPLTQGAAPTGTGPAESPR
jgi:hypothetical protein